MRVVIMMPPTLVEVLHDYRASFRPPLTMGAAVRRLVDDGLVRWINSLSPEEMDRIIAMPDED